MALAKPGDPFVTTRGQVVLSKKEPEAPIEIGIPRVSRHISSTRRSIKDFPADENTQKAIHVVMVYSLLGMTDNEIAHALNIKLEQIKQLKEIPAYQETFEWLFSELISINSSSMQSKIAAYAPKALTNLMELADDAKNENARVKANQDLMDRAGLHHETLYGKNSSDDAFSSLKIVITDGEEQKSNIEVSVGKKR